ncbi:hypothetical protein CBL_02353 [Carabus blaptoides fortunei]
MKILIFAGVVLAVCAYANGEECCEGALPYKIEVPVAEKQILRKHKYVIEKTSQPKPKPCFIYNAKVEKPVNTQQVQYEGLKTSIDRIVLPAPEEICQKSSEEVEYCSEEIDCGCSKCQKPKKTCGCGKIYASEESDCGCGKYEECKKIKYSSEEIDCGCKRCQESEEESEECKKIRYSSEEIDCGCRKCQKPAFKKVCSCNRRPVSSCESGGKIVQESSEEISCGCQIRHRPCQETKASCEESEEQICTKDSAEVGNCGCSKCVQKKPECESEEESVEQCGCGNKKRVHVKYGKFYSQEDDAKSSSQEVEYTNVENRTLKEIDRTMEDSEESSEYDEEHSTESNDSELIDDDNIEDKKEDAVSKTDQDLDGDEYCPCGCANHDDSSINQKICQDIRGAVKGSINQVINQDIDGSQGQSKSGTINQVISQDVVSTDCACKPESINQNIHQKVKHGSTCIDQKTINACKNHEKRQSRPSCSEEIVFKHHSKSKGCGNSEESCEEIKVCDSKHSSEIFIKTHEEKCGDVSEDSSEEICIKYKNKDNCKCKKNPCDCGEIILPKPVSKPCHISIPVGNCGKPKPKPCEESSEEIIVVKPKPCKKKAKTCEESQEEKVCKPCSKPKPCENDDESEEYVIRPKPCSTKISIKSHFIPCENPKVCDISSEETKGRPKPCGLKKCKDKSEEKNCFCNKPKPCDCEEAEESSEEIVIRPGSCNKPKPCNCKKCEDSEELIVKPFNKPKPCTNVEESSEEEIIIRRPVPCNKPKPCSCKTCDESSEEIIVKPCFKPQPKPCDSDSSEEEIIVRPKPCFKPFSSEDNSDEIVFKPWPVAEPCDQPLPKPCFKPKPQPCDDSEEYLTKVIPSRVFNRPVVLDNYQRCQRSANHTENVETNKVNDINKKEETTETKPEDQLLT